MSIKDPELCKSAVMVGQEQGCGFGVQKEKATHQLADCDIIIYPNYFLSVRENYHFLPTDIKLVHVTSYVQ